MVTSNLLAEELIPVRRLVRRLPGAKGAKHVSPATACRWCSKGVRLRDGTVLVLEHVRAGAGQILSSPAALSRFLERVTADRLVGDQVMQPTSTPSAQRREAQRHFDTLGDVLGPGKPTHATA